MCCKPLNLKGAITAVHSQQPKYDNIRQRISKQVKNALETLEREALNCIVPLKITTFSIHTQLPPKSETQKQRRNQKVVRSMNFVKKKIFL